MPDFTINQIITQKLQMLTNNGIDSSVFELKMLIGHILGIEPKYLSGQMKISKEQINILDEMLIKRSAHCPVDKIIGTKGFYKYDFIVNDNVLSPRADTEILVEKAIAILSEINTPKILELGVGSGCIILSILADLPSGKGIGVDISEDALAVTDLNAELLNIKEDRLELIKANWFDNDIEDRLLKSAPFDMIVSNPPYIPSSEIDDLDEEVKNYDPRIALDGGKDGLKDYGKISELAYILLKKGGWLLLEAGDGNQLRDIALIAQKHQLCFQEILKDLSGNERCIILKK